MFEAGILRETETDDWGVKSLLEKLLVLWIDSRASQLGESIMESWDPVPEAVDKAGTIQSQSLHGRSWGEWDSLLTTFWGWRRSQDQELEARPSDFQSRDKEGSRAGGTNDGANTPFDVN